MKVKTMKGYRFFVPSDYIQTPKESEMKQKNSENIITFQVKDLISIDFLDKMGDKEREIKIMCESTCDDIIKNLHESDTKDLHDKFLISSKPYVRKSNLIADKALCQCWETHFRFNQFDLFITVIRRSYIAPIMDMFQDIVVCSIKYFTEESNTMDQQALEIEVNKKTRSHLNDIHRIIVDSVHQIEIASQTQFFKNIIEERSNALLMDESTMKFYQNNLDICPDGIKYSVSYLMQLLNTLLRSNKD